MARRYNCLMSLTTSQWHTRFLYQSTWTQHIRRFLFSKAKIGNADTVLEVGCGTGAILSQTDTNAQLFGLDTEFVRLEFASKDTSVSADFVAGDALYLPFRSNTYDITFCHYLLLWLSNPEAAISEMIRLTCHDGYVIAFAEPDYSHRIDFPPRTTIHRRVTSRSAQSPRC